MQKTFKLLGIACLTMFSINACNSGSSSSTATLVNGPYASTSPSQALSTTCKFSSTNNVCTINLSYQANPAASLSITGVSSPYVITSNSCTDTVTNADCEVIITYTPQSTPSTQTAVLSVGGNNYNLTLTNG